MRNQEKGSKEKGSKEKEEIGFEGGHIFARPRLYTFAT